MNYIRSAIICLSLLLFIWVISYGCFRWFSFMETSDTVCGGPDGGSIRIVKKSNCTYVSGNRTASKVFYPLIFLEAAITHKNFGMSVIYELDIDWSDDSLEPVEFKLHDNWKQE